jgi:rhamnosyltransferase
MLAPSVGAVIVTYNPDQVFPDRLAAIANQVSRVVVIDNGSNPVSRIMLNRLSEKTKIEIIFNERNIGIASALNQGIKFLKSAELEWAITLDQDSHVDSTLNRH